MSVLFALTLACVTPSQDPEPVVARFRRVVGESWRDCAAAQVPQGDFERVGESETAWRLVPPIGGSPLTLELELAPKGAAPGQAELWADADRDGERAASEVVAFTGPCEEDPFPSVNLAPAGLDCGLTLFGHEGAYRGTVQTHYHFEADVEIDGQPVRLYFLDMDLDGRASLGDHWAALDARQQAFVKLPGLLFSANLASEPWYFGERVLVPQEAREDGSFALELRPQDRPRHEALAARAARAMQRFQEGYDETRDAFLAAYEIDPERPVDPAPPRWYHAWELSEALAVARDTGRPLLVEFGTDGCPWCKRYDWLNYKDAAVTERLRRFTLVKINRDLDPNQTAPGLGLDGVPCFVVFDHEGEAVSNARGWVAPRQFADQLDAFRAEWEAHAGR